RPSRVGGKYGPTAHAPSGAPSTVAAGPDAAGGDLRHPGPTERPHMRSQRLPFLALATTLGLALTACGGSAGETSGEGVLAVDKVTIGVVGTDPTHDALQRVAEEQRISVEYVDFSDYNQPNPANESGDVEMTWFQHVPFL